MSRIFALFCIHILQAFRPSYGYQVLLVQNEKYKYKPAMYLYTNAIYNFCLILYLA